MTYLLDTSAAIDALRGRPSRVRGRLSAVLASGVPVHISTIATHELWYGVARSREPEHRRVSLRTFLLGLSVLDLDAEDADRAGQLRETLAARGEPIGPYDVLIAAAGLRRGLTVVTSNVREFSRVPGLTVEDWTAL